MEATLTPEYCAGFFDGEGSVYAATRHDGRSPTIIVCISQVELTVLQAHQKQWGGSLNPRGGKHKQQVATGRWQQQHQWVLSAKQARPYLNAIYPYLIVKKAVVKEAIEYCALVQDTPLLCRIRYEVDWSRDGRGKTRPVKLEAFRAKQEALHARIKDLNRAAAPFNATRSAVA